MYEVKFVTSAAKEFRSLEHGIKRRVAAAIENLCFNKADPPLAMVMILARRFLH